MSRHRNGVADRCPYTAASRKRELAKHWSLLGGGRTVTGLRIELPGLSPRARRCGRSHGRFPCASDLPRGLFDSSQKVRLQSKAHPGSTTSSGSSCRRRSLHHEDGDHPTGRRRVPQSCLQIHLAGPDAAYPNRCVGIHRDRCGGVRLCFPSDGKPNTRETRRKGWCRSRGHMHRIAHAERCRLWRKEDETAETGVIGGRGASVDRISPARHEEARGNQQPPPPDNRPNWMHPMTRHPIARIPLQVDRQHQRPPWL